ncbi:MAG: ORF6N domain-containing protein [Pseudomonadota bacterium]|nr:ORF6N domain-containing protein [Pseudomonadota bacterium]
MSSWRMVSERTPIAQALVEEMILSLRGQRVILDYALAPLYCVEVRALNQAVQRNIDRFPQDFMFRLTSDEVESLRSQFVILKAGRGTHPKYPPHAFTEQGVAMLSGVLKSKRAIQVNIEIMRAFVRLRQLLSENAELSRKLDSLESKYDAQFKIVFDAIRELMAPKPTKSRPIGFIGQGGA